MKPPLKKPCPRCPFRRVAVPGWLGASKPSEFMEQTLTDQQMPCHCTVDYGDPLWREELGAEDGNARFCAGALIFFANILKRSRDRERPIMKPDRAAVFGTPREFFAHHHDWQAGERPKVDMEALVKKREALFRKTGRK